VAGTLVDFVNGYALALAGTANGPDTTPDDPMRARLATLTPDAAPTMRRVHATLPARSPADPDYFDTAVAIIIRGVSTPPS
jgi:hypothetical protein